MRKTSTLNTAALVGVLLYATNVSVEARPTQNQATIVIAGDKPAKTYEPMIFGGFIALKLIKAPNVFPAPGPALISTSLPFEALLIRRRRISWISCICQLRGLSNGTDWSAWISKEWL